MDLGDYFIVIFTTIQQNSRSYRNKVLTVNKMVISWHVLEFSREMFTFAWKKVSEVHTQLKLEVSLQFGIKLSQNKFLILRAGFVGNEGVVLFTICK